QVKLQWPYAGHWSALGENEISTGPALDRSGVLAFGAGNTLYGVLESDGSRAWSKATPSGASAPVADSGVFYCVTGKEGLIALDAHTGAVSGVDGFDKLISTVPPSGTYLTAPATDGTYIAAASPAGEVWVVEKTKSVGEKATAWKWKAPEQITGDLSITDGKIYLTAGSKLYQLDPAAKKVISVPINGPQTLAHGGSVFYRAAANLVARFASTDLTKPLAFFRVPDGVVVTGMVAASDLDLVVVATDKGDLHGLTFATLATRWATRVPAGTASSRNSLNTPVISGRSVFCTSSSGAVAAVDAHTGEFRGLFCEPTSIKTPPVVDSGEIYFGCSEAPAEANLLDGALHSVVFGQTHVLRLGLDRTGARETQKSYVSVTKGNLLKLMGVWESCVEAWVNSKEGGEVLSICPNADSRYGLRLWLDRDGKINYTCVDLPEETGASWEQITSAVKSSACDGKWHHIAVARSARNLVTIYLDGVALNATTTLSTVAQPLLSPGLKVFIGADATGQSPSIFFAGMIGEIRVWDTYLTATRISARMHDKLIGNEPDLLAYWNFDKLSLHDGSRNGHEGSFEGRDSSAGYWLADLNFTHPTYPFIETTGRMLQEGAEGS
ncbi:MAG TPA: PQQ-binding-like beta-propeller repeat protein, partial [Pyrinomonadaceae bacterium]|nr:PQQ-binding-like beta-propeller repeat protein [Pyrinomonadaceae bacterium]